MITDEERILFEELGLFFMRNSVALVEAEYESGERAVVIALVKEDSETGDVLLKPAAILDPDLYERVLPPT